MDASTRHVAAASAGRARLGSAARAARTPRRRSGRSRTRASGRSGGRRSTSPLEGHGLGGLRPRRARRRGVRAGRARRALAGATQKNPRSGMHPADFDAKLNCFVQAYGSQQLDASLLRCPPSAFCHPTMRGSQARLRRSSGVWFRTARLPVRYWGWWMTGCPRAKEHSLRAPAGSPTPMSCRDVWMTREHCSSGPGPAQRCEDYLRKSTTRSTAATGTFRRRSLIWPSPIPP